MKTIIISAFTGTGKTFYKDSSDLKVLDLTSDKIHEEFILKEIKKNIGIVDVILLDTGKEIYDLLVNNKINFFLVYPHIDSEYIFLNNFFKNVIQRSENKKIKQLKQSIIDSWEPCIKELMSQKSKKYCKHIVLKPNEYIKDIICKAFKLA